MSQYKSQQPFGATNQSRGVADQMRNLSFGSVLIGAAVGVIIGLIIGWQVWPVKWTDAWPTDLSQEAKAQYLAAVAQVYAYYPDDRAAETARTRLYGLQDNIGDEIAAAQNFFAENPQRDSNVYITMLAEMAAGLGVETGAPPSLTASPTPPQATAQHPQPTRPQRRTAPRWRPGCYACWACLPLSAAESTS